MHSSDKANRCHVANPKTWQFYMFYDGKYLPNMFWFWTSIPNHIKVQLPPINFVFTTNISFHSLIVLLSGLPSSHQEQYQAISDNNNQNFETWMHYVDLRNMSRKLVDYKRVVLLQLDFGNNILHKKKKENKTFCHLIP